MKLFANQGKVEVQAQNDALDIAAKQDIKIDSVDGKIDFSAAKEITLICGGSFVKISSAGIELGSSRNVTIKAAALQKIEPAKWLKSQLESNGVGSANRENIEQVLGYQSADDESLYQGDKFAFFDAENLDKPDNMILSSSDKTEVFLVDMVKFRMRKVR